MTFLSSERQTASLSQKINLVLETLLRYSSNIRITMTTSQIDRQFAGIYLKIRVIDGDRCSHPGRDTRLPVPFRTLTALFPATLCLHGLSYRYSKRARKERGGFRRGWAQMGPFRERARSSFDNLAKSSGARAPQTARLMGRHDPNLMIKTSGRGNTLFVLNFPALARGRHFSRYARIHHQCCERRRVSRIPCTTADITYIQKETKVFNSTDSGIKSCDNEGIIKVY
jgi:hypothetical protein